MICRSEGARALEVHLHRALRFRLIGRERETCARGVLLTPCLGLDDSYHRGVHVVAGAEISA